MTTYRYYRLVPKSKTLGGPISVGTMKHLAVPNSLQKEFGVWANNPFYAPVFLFKSTSRLDTIYACNREVLPYANKVGTTYDTTLRLLADRFNGEWLSRLGGSPATAELATECDGTAVQSFMFTLILQRRGDRKGQGAHYKFYRLTVKHFPVDFI